METVQNCDSYVSDSTCHAQSVEIYLGNATAACNKNSADHVN
jgi:hypothetical protein